MLDEDARPVGHLHIEVFPAQEPVLIARSYRTIHEVADPELVAVQDHRMFAGHDADHTLSDLFGRQVQPVRVLVILVGGVLQDIERIERLAGAHHICFVVGEAAPAVLIPEDHHSWFAV